MAKPTQQQPQLKRTSRQFYAEDAIAETIGTSLDLMIQDADPNPWNPNVQSKVEFEKLLNSIKRFGFTIPVVVRELGDRYQIVDGEHRWRAAKSLRMDRIPARNIGTVPDDVAKQLTVIFNELSGSPDEVRLADLLRDVAETVELDMLKEVMPFPDRELENLIESVDFSFKNLPSVGPIIPAPEDGDGNDDASSGAPAAADPSSAKAPAGGGAIGKVKHLKFQLSTDTHREMETKLAELGGDPNAHIVKAIRAYHGDELARRKDRKAKAKDVVKKTGGRRRVGKKDNGKAKDNADTGDRRWTPSSET